MFEKSPSRGVPGAVRPLAVILASLTIAACGGDEPDDNPGDGGANTPPTSGPSASDAPRRGFVLVRDVLDRTDDDTGLPRTIATGRVQAGFGDFSTVTSTAARIMPLGPVCFGILSRPVRDGEATPLPMGGVRVEGTARGEIIASEAGPSTYIATGEPLLGDGSSELRFVGDATPDGFGDFDERLAGLRGTVDLTAPVPGPEARLTIDPLAVAWAPAQADWAEITVRAPSDEVDDGGQVVCRVADEGTFTLPGAATAFLLADNASRYTLSVQLHRYRAVEEGDRLLEIEAVAETRLTLANGRGD